MEDPLPVTRPVRRGKLVEALKDLGDVRAVFRKADVADARGEGDGAIAADPRPGESILQGLDGAERIPAVLVFLEYEGVLGFPQDSRDGVGEFLLEIPLELPLDARFELQAERPAEEGDVLHRDEDHVEALLGLKEEVDLRREAVPVEKAGAAVDESVGVLQGKQDDERGDGEAEALDQLVGVEVLHHAGRQGDGDEDDDRPDRVVGERLPRTQDAYDAVRRVEQGDGVEVG